MFFATVTMVVLLGSIDPACAHPHVRVDAIAELILDDSHRLKAVRVYWAFDEVYTAIALEELHVEGDEEVQPDKLALLSAGILKRQRNIGTLPTSRSTEHSWHSRRKKRQLTT